MQKIHKRLTPNQITELSQCEIFVFGSNLEGLHMGGAARYAYDHFGAEWGNGVGPQGQCYAIPTMHGPLSDIKPYVDDFIEYARQHPMNRFLLTRIGCGIAGFKDKDMAPLFKERGIAPEILSRSLEDAGTLAGPMIPWHGYCVYMSGTLGVAWAAFFPYLFLLYLTPVFSIFYGFTGISIKHVKPEGESA